ncbi:MAG: TorF family putative porin [Gallionella sp.]|nr:TorF family putative porin [Gallionella sp.]MDP1941273.1 TorF family putative porin [Gallionella sp.]
MSHSKLLNTLILAALAVPSVALAEEASPFTANVGLTTDYLVRGISQTSGNPAIQGGIDYAHASGLYAGVWGSNVSWINDFGAIGSASMELDTYAGFRNSFAEDFSYDVGFIRYNYLGSYTPAAGTVKADTDEIYGALGYKWFTAKYSYGLGKFLTVPGAQGTNYLELNASVPMGETGITLGAHYGKQTYKGTAADALALAGMSPTYSDYKLSAAKEFGGYTVTLAYSDTNSPNPGFYTTLAGKDLARGTAVLSLTHAF